MAESTNIVYQADCMGPQGLCRFPNGFFDLAICDVPYGLDVGNMPFVTEQKTTVKQKNGTRLNPRKNSPVYRGGNWDKEPPGQSYFDELVRVSKHQIVFGVEYVAWKGLGPGRIKWDKCVPGGVSFKGYEMAYCSLIEHVEVIELLWSGMMQAKSLKHPTVQQGNKAKNEKRLHPCHKPRLLYRRLIQDYGFPGMNLLDTHIGAGSIRIEAHIAGCDFWGYEIDPYYWKVQEERYNKFLYPKQLKLFQW